MAFSYQIRMWLSRSHDKSASYPKTEHKLQLLDCAGHDITYLLRAVVVLLISKGLATGDFLVALRLRHDLQ